MIRCLDLEIWRFLCWRHAVIYPCARARSNYRLELELFRAHTSHAYCTICRSILLLVVRMSRKHTLYTHWVGTVDRCGYGANKKVLFYDTRGLYPLIWSTLKPCSFAEFDWFVVLTGRPIYQDMVIFVLTTTTRLITLSLAHAHRVMTQTNALLLMYTVVVNI